MYKLGGNLIRVDEQDIDLLIKEPKKFWENITFINDDVFCECNRLTSITIPNSVTCISFNAFKSCLNLTCVKIPGSVEEIVTGAFQDCVSLTDLTISNGVTTIESSAFKGCRSLESVTIPDSVTELGSYTFKGCSNLTNVTLSNSIKKIKSGLFEDCSNLINITIPESVTFIGYDAFANCSSLTNIIIPDSVKDIVSGAFRHCNFNYIYREKATNSLVLSRTLPENADAYEGVIDLTKLKDAFVGFDYDLILEKSNVDALTNLAEKLNKAKLSIPYIFIKKLREGGRLADFTQNSDFRFFKSENPNVHTLLTSQPSEEQFDFFKFATCLGCFSREKMKDKNGKETSIFLGQKSSALLAQLLRNGALKIGNFHELFDSLHIDTNPDQEFLNFLGVQGNKKSFPNVELLLEFERKCPGIFIKVMTNFEKVKSFRESLNESGMPITLPWKDALTKFYFSNKYIGVTSENQDMADLFGGKGISQCYFDEANKLRSKAKEEGVQSHILGKPIKEDTILESIEKIRNQTEGVLQDSKELIEDLYAKQFTYEMLDKFDAHNPIMGLFCSCCGTITSAFYGAYIARASVEAKDVQNMVVRNSRGRIIAKGTLYVNEKLGYGVFNDIEINNEYRNHEDKSGRYNVESDSKEEHERDMIFDAFMRGVSAFVTEYDAQHPDNPMKQINVGMGYNRLKRQCEKFEVATHNLTVPSQYSFNDAIDGQYILYSRKQALEKEGERTL